MRSIVRRGFASRSSFARHIAAVGLAAAMLAVPPIARADFTNVPLPAGKLTDFAAGQTAWIAVMDTGMGQLAYRSADGGANWEQLDAHGNLAAGAGPGGALYVAESASALRLLRFGDTGPGAEVPVGIPVRGAALLSAPSFDSSGRMWVAMSDMDNHTLAMTLTVARIENGSPVEQKSASSRDFASVPPELDATGAYPIVEIQNGYMLIDGALKQMKGGSGVPLWRGGGLTLWENYVSDDDGRSVHPAEVHLLPFHGDGGLAVGEGGLFLKPYQDLMMVTADLATPRDTGEVWATRDGYVAVSDPHAKTQFLSFRAGSGLPDTQARSAMSRRPGSSSSSG